MSSRHVSFILMFFVWPTLSSAADNSAELMELDRKIAHVEAEIGKNRRIIEQKKYDIDKARQELSDKDAQIQEKSAMISELERQIEALEQGY